MERSLLNRIKMNFMRTISKPTVSRTVEVEPYEILARYYDLVMEHVDYSTWAKYVINLHRLNRMQISNVTDLACGTGNLAMELADLGLNVVGVDGDPRMIEAAKKKPVPKGFQVQFHVGDLRQVPPVMEQDLILCLYDSMNYLLNPEDVMEFFRAVRPALRDEGLFIFDCSTETNSLSHFSSLNQTERIRGTVIHRQAWYDPHERIQNNQFEIFVMEEDTMYLEHHQQRIWSLDQIVEMVEQCDFKLLSQYDGYTFKQGSEQSDRVHFVVRPV